MDGAIGNLALPILLMVVFYFFMIRPQMKKAKDAKKFKEGIKKGDKVVTIGGIHGKIVEVKDSVVIIDVDGKTKLTLEKNAISPEYTKGTGESELSQGIKK